MAVTTTTIAGTDSLSGSRITINDNFKTLEDALNSVLSAFDIVTGSFNNATYGSANDITTNKIQINGSSQPDALDIVSGDINLQNGSIKIPTNKFFEIGSILRLENVEIQKITGSFNGWDLRGANKIQDQGAGGVVLPILSAGAFNDIDVTVGNQPELGTLVMTDENATTTDTPLRIWWDDGSGPGWYKITVTI